MKKVLCCYHANCSDGFAAAWVVHQAAEVDEVEFVPLAYYEVEKNLPEGLNFDGREVIIVDFSIKPEILLPAIKNANMVIMIDHHKSAQEDWGNVELPNNMAFIHEKDKSGALLTWDHFHAGIIPAPQVLQHISDRDLWNFELEGSRELHDFMMGQKWFREKDFDAFTEFVEEFDEDEEARQWAFERGRIISAAQDETIHFILSQQTKWDWVGDYFVPIVAMPHCFASRAAEILYETKYVPFVVTYADEHVLGVRRWSFRSKKGVGVDVSKIAQQFGGGGHQHAAGWMEKLYELGIENQEPLVEMEEPPREGEKSETEATT